MNNLPKWHSKYIELISRGSMHHAYLFFGREGIGKEILINSISNLILCENNKPVSCGKCQNCSLILSCNHPDLHILSKEETKKNISISQVLDLKKRVYESSFLGKNKIISISNLETMSRDASDAILKILEEPPNNTYFLMSSNLIHLIPTTIRSRSSEIEITHPSVKECRDWLSESYTENLDLAIELSDNRPFFAKNLLDLNLLGLRSNFIKEISGIIKSGKDIINISDKWNKDLETLPLKIEWMSCILIDAIKHQAVKEKAEVISDSENITIFLGEKSDIYKLHELLSQTNELWNLFSSDTNLRKEYQLQSLFIAWERELGISSL